MSHFHAMEAHEIFLFLNCRMIVLTSFPLHAFLRRVSFLMTSVACNLFPIVLYDFSALHRTILWPMPFLPASITFFNRSVKLTILSHFPSHSLQTMLFVMACFPTKCTRFLRQIQTERIGYYAIFRVVTRYFTLMTQLLSGLVFRFVWNLMGREFQRVFRFVSHFSFFLVKFCQNL